MTATIDTGGRRNLAGLRKHLIISILLDVALPLAGFYVLRGFGIGALAALLLSGLLVLPSVGYSVWQQRKVNMLTVFTISLLIVGTLMSVITGSPRLLLVREAWLFLVVGLWMLGTVPTRRPFMMIMGRSIVIAKVGMAGLLRPGGRIAVVSQPRCPGATAATSARAAHELTTALTEAGFTGLRTELLDLDPPAACVLGHRAS